MAETQTHTGTFLDQPELSDDVRRFYDADVDQVGYVRNLSRLWAYRPAMHTTLFDLMAQATRLGALTYRERCILVVSCASARRDAYCSLAWGERLAGVAGTDVAAGVVQGRDGRLDPAEHVLARWARKVAGDPNATDAGDVQDLREAGYDDTQIFAITAFVAARIAFAIVNDALGAQPDAELLASVPAPVRDAVAFELRVAG